MSAKERPILFNDEMVRAILDGRKTMTRRPVKPQPSSEYVQVYKIHNVAAVYPSMPNFEGPVTLEECPFGSPGDRLWVREAWRLVDFELDASHWSCAVEMRADGSRPMRRFGGEELADERLGWRPSIHMPRWASRITLEVKAVRVERVQEISGLDAVAEGFPMPSRWDEPSIRPERFFQYAWDSIYAPKGLGWDQNPWVWVVEFERVAP